MLRIARESYGPTSPLPRTAGACPDEWSRYDTPGSTIYACADRVTAYMEMLAPFRTDINDERRALQPVADAMEMYLDDLWHDVVTEWGLAGMMKASWMPRVFREGRKIYTLQFPDGWWIDITAIETITTLENLRSEPWPTAQGTLDEPLTLAHLTGDDRTLTTAIADELRSKITLDDGTQPLGIRFLSKHGHPAGGTGICWAYWMRDVDNDPTIVRDSAAISETCPAFLAVQKYCKIKSR